jgi:phosphoesterase RecJ-like protein
MTWPDLDAILRGNTSFLITTHVNPDGDCIGSQLAVLWYLESLGKQVTVFDRDPVPGKFAFLQNSGRIITEQPAGPFDVLIVLDCSNPDRLGWEGSGRVARHIVNIDHHRDNTNFGALNIVLPRAATAEILCGLFAEGAVDYPTHVAEALYAAILTDTGGFRFSNTSAAVLRVCAGLAERGADCAGIYERVYAFSSQAGMRLHAAMWPSLAFHAGGRICTMELPLRLIEELGATYGDAEGMADLTIMAEGVQVGVFVKHTDRLTHFSLRSKSNDIDVGSIARMVKGGGGHVNAAGCTMEEPVDTARPRMLAIIERELG